MENREGQAHLSALMKYKTQTFACRRFFLKKTGAYPPVLRAVYNKDEIEELSTPLPFWVVIYLFVCLFMFVLSTLCMREILSLKMRKEDGF